jgi:hypothetical protein
MISPLDSAATTQGLCEARRPGATTPANSLDSFGSELSSRLETTAVAASASEGATPLSNGGRGQNSGTRGAGRQNLVTGTGSAATETGAAPANSDATESTAMPPSGPTPGWTPAMGSIITLPWMQSLYAANTAADSTPAAATGESTDASSNAQAITDANAPGQFRSDVNGYNSLQYASDDDTQQLAQLLGGTVAQTNASGYYDIPQQNEIVMPGGVVMNAGLTQQMINVYGMQQTEAMISAEMVDATSPTAT